MIKNTLNPLSRLPAQMPGDQEVAGAVKTIDSRLKAKEADLQKLAHAAKVPVEHEVIITAAK